MLAPDTFAVPDVLAVKHMLHKSGIMLRLASRTKAGAGLATQTSYNAMHWARSLSMLMRDVRGGQTLLFTEELWTHMLRCQGEAHLKEPFFLSQATDVPASNELLRVSPGLTCELLLVAMCDSRQA